MRRCPILKSSGARMARTTVPVKHHIECYECSYKFQMHGRATTTHCPKCRTLLDLTDHTIDAECVETVKTAGTIRLTPTGVLKSGNLIGSEVILEGIVEGGRAARVTSDRVGRRRDLFGKGRVRSRPAHRARARSSSSSKRSSIAMSKSPAPLRAKLTAMGVVTVKPGGLLEGEIKAVHLVVEDGGGLKAKATSPRNRKLFPKTKIRRSRRLWPASAPHVTRRATQRDIPAAGKR